MYQNVQTYILEAGTEFMGDGGHVTPTFRQGET